MIELADGRLLLAYTHFYQGGSDFGAGDIRGKISEDGGDTWRRSLGEISVHFSESGRDFAYADFEEPAVVELRDGRLLCFGRTRLGEQYQSTSEDGGVTWGPAQPSGLAASYSPASLKTIPKTGDIVCVWNQVSGQEIADGLARMRMSCAVSKDDGKTWEHFKNLESLDDRTRIAPEETAADTQGEMQAIQSRLARKARPTQKDHAAEVRARYPRRSGYKHVDYASTCFSSEGNVLIQYGVYGPIGEEPTGQKLVVRPIEWLYE